MQAVILAAGRGNRLHPITLNRSKAMVPILDKPIVERVMEGFFYNGIREFLLVVRHDDREIVPYFQNTSKMQVNIEFIYQMEHKGMADALRLATPFITGEFILSACDNLIPSEDISKLLDNWCKEPQRMGLLTLMEIDPDNMGTTGNVICEGPLVTRIIEKPANDEILSNLASLPLYCFTPNILEYLPEVQLSPRGEYEIQDAIQLLIQRDGLVHGFTVKNRMTLTEPDDLLPITKNYLKINNQQHIPIVGSNTQLISPIYIQHGAIVGENCTIGPFVFVENGARLGNKVTIRNAIILRNCTIQDGTVISDQVLV